MQINPQLGLSALQSVAGTGGFGIAGLAAGSGSAFGPAALVSIGASSAGITDPMAGVYSALAGAAISRGTAAAALSPKMAEMEAGAVSKANKALEVKDIGTARRILDDLLGKIPASAAGIQALGHVELASGDYDKAEKLYRRADALDSSLGAVEDAENARALKGDDSGVLARARRLSSNSDTRAAGMRLLETLVTRSPKNFDARVALATEQLRSGERIKGLVSYSMALSISDEAQTRQLEARFEGFVKRAPGDAFLQNLLGKAQLRLGSVDKAVETLELATRLSEDNATFRADEAQAHVAVARTRLSEGRIDAALAAAERAYLLDPADKQSKLVRAEAFTARAERRLSTGDLRRASDDFARAARDARAGSEELIERIARGSYTIGARLQARRQASDGRIDGEVAAFQTAYDLDPENRSYRIRLAGVREELGQQYLDDGDLKNGAANMRMAYELDRSNTAVRDTAISSYRRYAESRLEVMSFDEAISSFRLAFDLNPADTTSRTRLAEAYNLAGLYQRDQERNNSRAAGYFREAMHLFPDNQTYLDNYDSVRSE